MTHSLAKVDLVKPSMSCMPRANEFWCTSKSVVRKFDFMDLYIGDDLHGITDSKTLFGRAMLI